MHLLRRIVNREGSTRGWEEASTGELLRLQAGVGGNLIGLPSECPLPNPEQVLIS